MSESTRFDAFRALCLARFREFYREPEVVFWGFVFPILLAVALGLAFRNRPPETLAVMVVEGEASASALRALGASPLLKTSAGSAAEAAQALRLGKVEVVVGAGTSGYEYRLDPSRPEALVARARVDDALQRAAGRRDPVPTREEAVTEPGGRYIDFLVPGIIGMNLMSAGMWGMGFVLVDMRIKKLLKRLLATPLRRADFLLAQMTTRTFLTFVEVSLVLLFARLAFRVPVRGSVGAVLFVGMVGALAFSGIGLLVGSRATRIESVTGLMNVVMVPMFIASGIFFSADRFPDALQPLVRALPLTALNDALRAVILEGATLASQSPRLLLLGAWGGLSFLLGLRLFRWS
ncbi:MAG TPA: ABC transporter permease [Vicinamibacteria bacterium]